MLPSTPGRKGRGLKRSRSRGISHSRKRSPSAQMDTRSRRYVSVYDAVAGRISVSGFIRKTPYVPSTRDTAASSIKALPPDAVLFRRKNAPTRYAEKDFYFANDDLKPGLLPTSELLKAIHSYTADFYNSDCYGIVKKGQGNWKSMDGTALIAMGILMEECVKKAVGRSGFLALLEGEERPEGWMSDEDETVERDGKRNPAELTSSPSGFKKKD